MTMNPNTWPSRESRRNWSLGAGVPRWFHWRGTGATPEAAFAFALRDAQRIMTVLTDGRATLPAFEPTPNGRIDPPEGDTPWATSFGASDCDIEIMGPMLEAAGEPGPSPAPKAPWWRPWGKPSSQVAPARTREWTRDDATAAARALARICARRLLRERDDAVTLWIGSHGTSPLSIALCPFVDTRQSPRGHSPLPEPYRAAMAAISTAHAISGHPTFAKIREQVPASASARAVWNREDRTPEDVWTLAGFLTKAGLPEDANALLALEAGGWTEGEVG